MSTTAQITANQANAKLSTGPQTEAGKAASAQNNFRHGLAGAFVIREWEKEDEYYDLLHNLRQEHQPATPTEILLVETMAKHFWLAQRAVQLQELCFHATLPTVDRDFEKQLALYLRYQTTHERAFHKCLNDLMKMRAQQQRERREKSMQTRQHCDELRKKEMHEARLEAVKAQTELAQAKTDQIGIGAKSFVPPADYDYEARKRQMFAADAAQEAELQEFLQSQRAA